MPIDDSTIAALKAEHGEILHLETDYGEAIFRVAKPTEWQRFLDEVTDAEVRARALKTLVLQCVVHPERVEFERLIAARPGLVQTFGNELTSFCGLGRAAVRKK